MCVGCIRTQVDLTDGITKHVTLLYCAACGRYLQPPRHWVKADPESRELLTFCVKRVKGLSKVKLVDAGFVWTEPHSKRLKVKLSVQVGCLVCVVSVACCVVLCCVGVCVCRLSVSVVCAGCVMGAVEVSAARGW